MVLPRDPIVLFVVLGAALAALHLATRPEESGRTPGDFVIVVSDADVAWLRKAHEKVWKRPPTKQELENLVDSAVRDEMLSREAVALGLDKGDDALRRRLAQKVAFLVKDAGAAYEPTDAELQAHLDANPEKYAVEPRRRYAQVYVNVDRRGKHAGAHAKALLANLKAGGDPATLGDRIILELEQPPSTPFLVERQFGAKFSKALFVLPAKDEWQGPIPSGYGLHLVRIHEAVSGRAPPLEAVRDRVRSDVVDVRRETALDAYVETLRKKYDVRIEASELKK